MNKLRIDKLLKWQAAAAISAGLLSLGCSMVTEDPVECPAELRVSLAYDYNLKFADAFAHEVKSVNVWAFDTTGKPVWSGSADGDALTDPDFHFATPLKEGRYDFVSWCGLKDNGSFDLATYTPSSKEELTVKLRTLEQEGQIVCSDNLPDLYHGNVTGVDFAIDPYRPSVKTVTIPLVKNTKDIRVMLMNLDGSAMKNRDFSVTITVADGIMAWDNTLSGSPTVTYKPYYTKYGETEAPGGAKSTETVSALLFYLATGRLMDDGEAIQTVHRNSDNKDIIRIRLTDYLLLVKGYYPDKNGNEIGDQEYLDRQDDYSMVFFIDPESDWNKAAGIYINKWAVVPLQDEPL